MNRRHVRAALLLAAAALLPACGAETPAAPSEPTVVRSTTSFGFCPVEAMCSTSLEVAGGVVTFIASSRAGVQERQTAVLLPDEWASLERKAQEARFEGLAPVLGCPDCADGGAETVSVVSAGQSKKVTFEFGANVPPVATLVDSLREIRRRFWGASRPTGTIR